MPMSLVDGALGEMTRLKPPRRAPAIDGRHAPEPPAPGAAAVAGGGVSAVGAHRLAAMARELAWPGTVAAVLTVIVLAYAIQPPHICTDDGDGCHPRWGVVLALAAGAGVAAMGIAYYLRTLTK